jgi:hypothetical protein
MVNTTYVYRCTALPRGIGWSCLGKENLIPAG